MATCPHCNVEVPDEACFCESCGKPIGSDPLSAAETILPKAAPESLKDAGVAAEIDEGDTRLGEAPVEDMPKKLTAMYQGLRARLDESVLKQQDPSGHAVLDDLLERARGQTEQWAFANAEVLLETASEQLEGRLAALGAGGGSGSAETAPTGATRPGGLHCPVRFEFNKARFYVEGTAGTLEYRLVNVSAETLGKVQVDVDCRFVEGYRMNVLRDIPAGGAGRRLRSQCRFVVSGMDAGGCAGQHIVGLTVTVDGGGLRRVFRGEWEILVLPRAETPQQVLINVKDAVHIEGDKGAMGGAINVPINVTRDVASGAIQDVHALLRQLHGAKAEWAEVQLWLEDEMPLAEAGVASGAKKLEGRAASVDRLRLDIAWPAGKKRVLLVAKPEVLFGRARRKNDIALVVLPLGGDNDRKSLMISSGRHFSIVLDEKGLSLSDSSTRGTVVGSRMLKKGESCDLPGKTIDISPGGALTVRLTPLGFRSGFVPAEYENAARGGTFRLSSQSGVAALRVERVDNFPDETYVLVYAGFSLGGSSVSGIPVEGAGLSPRHLLFLYLGDGFYVENISGTSVDLNGRLLPEGEIVPLSFGDRIRAADAAIEVGEFEHLRPRI